MASVRRSGAAPLSQIRHLSNGLQPMQPKLAESSDDQATMFGLRLMKSFLQLRSRARREEPAKSGE
jgi:hypothetical protein